MAVLAAGCAPDQASVGHGREDSWHRVPDPIFTAGPSAAINGLVGPGDGYPTWTAVGSMREGGAAPNRAVVWSSADGTHWGRHALDTLGAQDSTASAGARRQGLEVVVGTVTTARGDRDAQVWTSRDGATWSAVPLGGGSGDQSLTRVAAGPLGFLATGDDSQPGRRVPALWWSSDGTSWSRAGLGPGTPFSTGQSIRGVAVGRLGMVAVGTIDTSGDVDAMAWFSADGATWRTVPLGAAGFTGPATQAANAVTATADGFVAVGNDAGAERRFAVAWTTADGVTWRRQPPSPDMAELPTGDSTRGVSAEAIAGSGPVVAVGGGYALQVWTSPDGRRWTREEPPSHEARSGDGAVVATDGSGRAMLVRTGGGGLWYRPPGAAWASVDSDTNVFPRAGGAYRITSMVRAGGRLLAFGTESGPSGSANALWVSNDGRTWERSDSSRFFAGAHVDAVTMYESVVVAAGVASDPGPADASVAAVWTSADAGDSWQRVGAGNPAFSIRGTTQMFGVAAAGPGLVAVGLTYEIHETTDAHAWYSADGRTWQRATEPPVWSGPGDQQLQDVCSLPGGGALALGTSIRDGKHEPWAWISRDGATWEDGAPALRAAGVQFTVSCASDVNRGLVVGQRAGDGGGDGALWETVDGRSWRSVGHTDTFGGAGDERLIAVAIDGDRIVVTGHEDGDLTVYSSADGGSRWQKSTSARFGGSTGSEPVMVDDRVVVAGQEGSSAAVWIGPGP